MFSSKFTIGAVIVINLFMGLSAAENNDPFLYFMNIYNTAEKGLRQMQRDIISLENDYNLLKNKVNKEILELYSRIDDGVRLKNILPDSPNMNIEKIHKKHGYRKTHITQRILKNGNGIIV